MHWKLKENIRLNKVCSTCEFGSCMSHNHAHELCLKDMDEEECMPANAPRIKTCLDWRDVNGIE